MFAASVIEIPPVSTEISRHASLVLTDGQLNAIPEHVMPLRNIGRGINIYATEYR